MMQLTITTPQATLNVAVTLIRLQTSTGDYTILPGHAPLLLALLKGSSLTYVDEHDATITEQIWIERAGIAMIDRQSCHIMLA